MKQGKRRENKTKTNNKTSKEVKNARSNSLIYINDIAENINSNICLFADDCVVYNQIDSLQDHLILQEDLNKLVEPLNGVTLGKWNLTSINV